MMQRFFWLSDKELAALVAALTLNFRLSPGGKAGKLLRWAQREQASRV